jgi:renalase
VTRRIVLEVAVSTPDEAVAAAENGADRLELSSALEVGGLTPSLGLFDAVKQAVAIPVYVLLRPRPGGFCYTDREFEAMVADAKHFTAAGATGLVFGVLTEQGTIDGPRCAKLVGTAGGHAVFHRAFDFLADPFAALDELISLGFRRILTSGGQSSAKQPAAQERLAELVRLAASRIEILPAGGIRADNVAELVRHTRCDQVHSSARAPVVDPLLSANPQLAAALGADASGNRTGTSAEVVAALRTELDRVAISLSSPI